LSMSGIYDEEGNIVYIQATVEDITDRKKKEEELERLRQQYTHAQKMEALGTLTGGIAHDFNNFLTAVTGYATILKMKLGNKLDLYRYLDQIMSVSEKMADLVKSLLAFSRKQPITLEPIDLNMEVEQTKKLLKRLLTENIKIELFTSKKNPVIMADKTQLNQILFNLTTNARDAMPDGGTFTIKISTAVLYEDFIKTHGFGNQGQYAVISVSDTGIGMDKEIMSKIFDPFFTTKEHGKGTGLGLASVYGIVKQHNGYITVDSSPGKGATFNIYFPLVDMTAKKDIKEHVTIGKGTGRILIGEDDENVREYLKEVLTECGYRVFEAEDGEKLVKVFKEQDKIDLIITDVVMPNKGGIDAYNEIKAIKEDTKFIFISGYDKDAYYNIPRQDKAVRFLLKPVSTDTLIQTIDEVLKI
ncbi:MAG: ATP-binding protein, partial [Syntrophorhabdaceae bacterium]|nr:ATP-binding protein [Syntrophorhabdaceae bacterium]